MGELTIVGIGVGTWMVREGVGGRVAVSVKERRRS